MTDSAQLIHRQLEVLKYFGEERKITSTRSVPTGQGMRVDITLLPDILLDIRRYNVNPNVPGATVCAIGGRAARTAVALLHLVDDNDGLFDVHLLTKTGNLGKLLLENEFYDSERKETYKRLRLGGVRPHDREPRFAVWKSPNELDETTKPEESSELGEADLTVSMLETLCRSRAVYFASITTPNFKPLFTRVLDTANPSRPLLLDATRGDEHLVKLLWALTELRRRDRKSEPVLFLPEHLLSPLLNTRNEKDISRFCDHFKVDVIRYTTDGNDVMLTSRNPSRDLILNLPQGTSFSEEDIQEYFKAGIILASTVHNTVGDVPDETIRKRLIEDWNVDDPWAVILDYGVRFATALKASAGGTSLREALLNARNNSENEFQPFSPSAGTRRFRLGRNQIKEIASLANARHHGSMLCPALAVCENPKCDPCPRAHGAEEAAVLLDLDGTLFDSTEQRNKGLEQALPALRLDSPETSVKQSVEFFTEHIYDHWEIFEIFGLGNFRQEWNHPGWYITYILLREDNEFIDQLAKLPEKPNNGGGEELRLKLGAWRQQVQDTPWRRSFLSKYNSIANDEQESISRARAAFAGVEMEPLKEARDLLYSLKLTGAFNVYVVSEGNPDTQWMKVRRTGLDEFFDREHVLTTGDAANAAEERLKLARELANLANARTKLSAELGRWRERRDALQQMKTDLTDEMKVRRTSTEALKTTVEVIEKQVDSLTASIVEARRKEKILEEREKLGRFSEIVLSRMVKKYGPPFYAAVVRAILRSPKSPLTSLRSFSSLTDYGNAHSRMKFAMIGDSELNDIRPPHELLGQRHILTIRLLSGKYFDQPPVASSSATYWTDTLAGVKAILLSKQVWDQIECKGNPRIFNCRIVLDDGDYLPLFAADQDFRIGLSRVTQGASLPPDFEHIAAMCAGIVAENLLEFSASEKQEVLGPYLDRLPEDSRLEKVVYFLSNMVATGVLFLAIPEIEKLRERFRLQLEACQGPLSERFLSNDGVVLCCRAALDRLRERPA